MNTTDILANVLQKKGQFGRAKWSKQLKTRKGITDNITKRTQMVVRAGIDYDNMKSVQEKRESGELPAENAGLPWGRWVEGCFPYLIHHKEKHYVRLYPNGNVQTQYYLNGNPVELDAIKEFVLASELPKIGEKPDCITVCLDNMEELV
jgi:hypothetical protein